VKVSVVIPSRGERFLAHTVKDVLEKATGDIEVIVTLDGYWPDPPLPEDPRLILLHRGKALGMRHGINGAVDCARGDFIVKLDGHCMVAEGFDEVLKADCKENWVVVPRLYSLDAENWCRRRGKAPVDYWYLSYPNVDGALTGDGVGNVGDRGGPGLHGRRWDAMNKDEDLKGHKVQPLMSAQGSCWIMHRAYYEELELEDYETYGTFGSEFQEIGLKCWLSGGQVMVNKNTWYAHLHKGKKYGRGWPLQRHDADQATTNINEWFSEDDSHRQWHKQTLPFRSMIHKFWPVPGWPQEWAP
jgi:hypothetical protein